MECSNDLGVVVMVIRVIGDGKEGDGIMMLVMTETGGGGDGGDGWCS